MVTFLIILAALFILLVIVGSKNKKRQDQIQSNAQEKSIEFTVGLETNSQPSPTERDELNALKEKYPKWYANQNTVGECFKKERIEPLANNSEETVHYKSDRYAELFGRGKDCSYFPGYGRICNRTFTMWYQETGSTEKKGLRKYKDIANDSYQAPVYIEDFTNGILVTNELSRTQGFKKLFNGRDEKNRKTWYAGLEHLE